MDAGGRGELLHLGQCRLIDGMPLREVRITHDAV
jgi:hypothetical protein